MFGIKSQVFFLAVSVILDRVESLKELPRVEENDIKKTEDILRKTTNNLFSLLKLKTKQKSQHIKFLVLFHHYLCSITLQDYTTLKEVAKLTRVDKKSISNGVQDFIAILNDLLDDIINWLYNRKHDAPNNIFWIFNQNINPIKVMNYKIQFDVGKYYKSINDRNELNDVKITYSQPVHEGNLLHEVKITNPRGDTYGTSDTYHTPRVGNDDNWLDDIKNSFNYFDETDRIIEIFMGEINGKLNFSKVSSHVNEKILKLIIGNGKFGPKNINDSEDWEVFRPNPELLPSIGRRIFKGKTTKIKYYPFMASVLVFEQFTCAGSIIKSDLVITAASCLQLAYNNRLFRENPAFLSVRIGSTYFSVTGEVIPVIEVYFHPGYNPKTLKDNLAIMRLQRKINFKHKNVKKIEFDQQDNPLPVNTDSILVLGWGAKTRSNKIQMDNRLSASMIDVFPLDECRDTYGRELVTQKHFCGGYFSKGSGACNQDVGGPGVVDGLLVGVISFGSTECGDPGIPTVFTKVGFYSDWIEEIMEMEAPERKGRTTTEKTFFPPFTYDHETTDSCNYSFAPIGKKTIKSVLVFDNANKIPIHDSEESSENEESSDSGSQVIDLDIKQDLKEYNNNMNNEKFKDKLSLQEESTTVINIFPSKEKKEELTTPKSNIVNLPEITESDNKSDSSESDDRSTKESLDLIDSPLIKTTSKVEYDKEIDIQKIKTSGELLSSDEESKEISKIGKSNFEYFSSENDTNQINEKDEIIYFNELQSEEKYDQEIERGKVLDKLKTKIKSNNKVIEQHLLNSSDDDPSKISEINGNLNQEKIVKSNVFADLTNNSTINNITEQFDWSDDSLTAPERKDFIENKGLDSQIIDNYITEKVTMKSLGKTKYSKTQVLSVLEEIFPNNPLFLNVTDKSTTRALKPNHLKETKSSQFPPTVSRNKFENKDSEVESEETTLKLTSPLSNTAQIISPSEGSGNKLLLTDVSNEKNTQEGTFEELKSLISPLVMVVTKKEVQNEDSKNEITSPKPRNTDKMISKRNITALSSEESNEKTFPLSDNDPNQNPDVGIEKLDIFTVSIEEYLFSETKPVTENIKSSKYIKDFRLLNESGVHFDREIEFSKDHFHE